MIAPKPAVVMVAVAVLAAGCWRQGRIAETAAVSLDGLVVEVSVGSCDADLTTEVEESRDRVVVTVTVKNDTSDDCRDSVKFTLTEPLGERALINGRTGKEIAVFYTTEVQP